MACLTAVTGGATLGGLTAQLEARGAGGDSQLGAGDVPLLHKDLLLHSHTLIDDAGVPWGGPVRANLQSEHQSQARLGSRSQGECTVPSGSWFEAQLI